MVTIVRQIRARRRNQRGAMSVVEVIVASSLGLMVLAFVGTLFSTLSFGAMATGKRTDAEVQTREALDGAMRYLRNSVPLASCAHWSRDFSNGSKYDAANAKYCARFVSDSAVVVAVSPTSFTTYAYADATDVSSGAAPERLTFTIAPAGTGSTLTVSKAAFVPVIGVATGSMSAAKCSAVGVGSSAECPVGASFGAWGTPTTLWSISVAPNSVFQFLNDAGSVTTDPTKVRTVIVDLSVAFNPNQAQAKYLESTFPYYASVALRGSRFADELNAGKR